MKETEANWVTGAEVWGAEILLMSLEKSLP